MNKIDPYTENKLREMVRAGMSTRQMATKAGVSRNTASNASLKYRHEAPICRHDKPLYECSSCFGSRRTANTTRDIIWLTAGPRKKARITNTMSAEDVLKNALMGALDDRGG